MTLIMMSVASAQGDGRADIAQAISQCIPDDFWGAISVMIDDEVVHQSGHGLADLDRTPMTVDHLFDLASVTKQFTATAILKLQMQGKLDINDRVMKHIDSVLYRTRIDKTKLTIRHLLEHSSGLTRVPDLSNVNFDDRDTVVRAIFDLPNESAPGTQFAYSNLNYFLLAAIIELASGETYEDFLREELFEPAGLERMSFIGDESIDPGLLSARVSNGLQTTARDYFWNWGYRGAGGVLGSAREMGKWLSVLQARKVLDEDALNHMLTPGVSGFGCGWQVESSVANTRRAFHGGTTGGYHTYVIWRPDELSSIVVLTNEDHSADTLAGAIERVIFPAAQPQGVEVAVSAYKQKIDEDGRIVLDRNLRWHIMPEKRGIGADGVAFFDDRLTMVLWDQSTNEWPVVINADDETATQWLATLRSIVASAGSGKAGQLSLALNLNAAACSLQAESPSTTLPADTEVTLHESDGSAVLEITGSDDQSKATITMDRKIIEMLIRDIDRGLRQRGVGQK